MPGSEKKNGGHMRDTLVENLRCPIDLGRLQLEIFSQDPDGHIITGQLHCTACRQEYQISQGVPNMLSESPVKVHGRDMNKLQSATKKLFGFEWRYFRDWGWLTKYPNVQNAEAKFYGGLLEHTQSAFWSKSLFNQNDFQRGLLTLDAGCGNGRFTYQATLTGAETIGIDLGEGVVSAFENTRSLTNCHIVRGDLYRLPFADGVFDRIFSIGVLQHTGDARVAFDSLVRTLSNHGMIVAHVYGRGIPSYEIIDTIVRAVTTRLSIRMQMIFSHITAATARWLRSSSQYRFKLYKRLFRHINLLPTEHHMFDWWSAPIATHHTLDEVLSWYARNKLEIVRCNPPLNDEAAERARYQMHGSITVLGKLNT